MRIFLFTSDAYLEAVRVHAWLLHKYWQPAPEVVVCGFTPPTFELPAGYSFYSIGAMASYPVTRWSNAARHALLAHDDEIVIVMLEDYWLTRGVDTEAVRMAYDYCRQFAYVARFDLTADRANAGGARFYGTIARPSNPGEQLPVVISDPAEGYHMSLMTGVWRKEHLLRVLRPSQTPWDVEIAGTPRLREMRDVIVLGYDKEFQPVKHTLGFRDGESGTLSDQFYDEMAADDVAALRAEGLLAPWEDE